MFTCSDWFLHALDLGGAERVYNWLCMESALNLRGNQMTRVGAKPILDVMRELNILRLVDMRGNLDKNLLGVLEGGEHYTTFSSFQVGRLYIWLLSLSSLLRCKITGLFSIAMGIEFHSTTSSLSRIIRVYFFIVLDCLFVLSDEKNIRKPILPRLFPNSVTSHG